LVTCTNAATVEELLGHVTNADLKKLAKGLDPNNTGVGGMTPAALSAHIVGRVTGKIPEVPEPPKPESLIRTVGSRAERQALLQALNATQLKSYIKSEKLRPAGVPPKANKGQLVRHILDELDAAEASGPRLLMSSKYGAHAPSR
jgi:hypothetical protein